ncbi:hypothetical protein FRY74_03460 [Vicingus serpentipes]|uniref:Uncharacterized protein n=1 Tax=Vicingus serpentipes TaxID=1926625 RepID=A0A5C6RXG4_9FLAO|nr:hypothetical protein [Vicingus serpentipes]TXB67256.1 hypothetical protein FRY74_03460 [Vicingus serpentipes]
MEKQLEKIIKNYSLRIEEKINEVIIEIPTKGSSYSIEIFKSIQFAENINFRRKFLKTIMFNKGSFIGNFIETLKKENEKDYSIIFQKNDEDFLIDFYVWVNAQSNDKRKYFVNLLIDYNILKLKNLFHAISLIEKNDISCGVNFKDGFNEINSYDRDFFIQINKWINLKN